MLDPKELFTHKLLLVTGKGGIGKSLVTAALGQAAAAAGRRVLLVESVYCDQLAPLFGGGLSGRLEQRVAPNLDCLNINATDNFRDYITRYLDQRLLYDTIFSHRVVQSFINTIPGLAQLMLLGRLFYHCELAPAPRYDLVIFDGFASGHFLSLMTTPEAALRTSLGGPMARETERVLGFLKEKDKCGVVYVAVPEALVVSETLDFLPQLASKSPTPVRAVVVNRLPAVAAAAPGAATEYLQRLFSGAQRALSTLHEGLAALASTELGPLPVWTLPELGFVNEPLDAHFASSFFAAAGGN